ncbi:MAG: tyrosyl-tRNA synthetase [Planctomycetota bacterium]|jgi:tyrosyl-tRNA synthetase
MDEKKALDPKLAAEVDRQMELITRGCAEMIGDDQLRKKIARSLKAGKPLRAKLGVDPTAHDLHLGFTLPLSRLRTFSDLGHVPVLIIGDATAMVGDPTGKNKARPQLTREMVDDFSASYLDQAAKVLEMDRVEVRRNSEWLHPLGFTGLISLAAKVTVAQIMARDDFSKRYSNNTPISLHEFIYPLMQAYDSVVVEADVEIGGQDQLFNLLLGRDFQKDAGQEEQVCLLTPLLIGLDGTNKMSKSFGNYIGVTEPANDMFGKVMSIPDDLMRDYFTQLTSMPAGEVDALLSASKNPRETKDQLGQAIVKRFWDEASALGASDNFRRVISEKQVPDEMPSIDLDGQLNDGEIGLINLIVLAGFAASNGEARRLIKQGGVKIDGESVSDERSMVKPQDGQVLKVGKRKYGRLSC